jgi:hypothetical protein
MGNIVERAFAEKLFGMDGLSLMKSGFAVLDLSL